MRHQQIEIGNLIVASNEPTRYPSAVTLVDLEGWDTPPEVSRNTARRIFGHGEYYSRLSTFGSKEFTVTISVNLNGDNPRIVRTAANQIAARINDLNTITMTYYNDGINEFKEVMQALPAAAFYEEWQPQMGEVQIALNFYAPDPFKTVYLNGSETAETERRL